MENKELANYPWVFWFQVSYRPKWFSYNWRARGANFIEVQLWVFKISIGRPWLKSPVDAHVRDYGSAKYVHNTNQDNLKQRFSFICKSPKMENKALRIMVGLTPEERDFLNLLQHEDAAANLSQAVAWCIDSCMKIEKLYGIDACYVAYNDIRKPENDPTLAAGHQHSPPSPAIEGIKWVCPECGRIYDSKPASCSFCNSGPTFTAEGEEELDRLESFNREEVKNILMEFSYDLQQEKYGGCSTHRHIVSLFIKAHRELFSTPTPPAGAEGEGEKKLVHPEDLKQVEKTILEVLDTYLSVHPISGKRKAANYLALWMTGFWSAMDEGAEQWRSDFMNATEKLSTANNMIASHKERLRITLSNFDVETADLRIARDRIAELEQTIREQKEWINSHL